MPFRKRVSLGFYVAAGCCLSMHCIDAAPSGFSLQSGDALPPVQKNGALVIENTTNSMVDWESFSIGLGEKVIFQQLHNNTYVLNRVTGGMESQLLGTLQSNGSVYLINPNGIVIGQDALIDTAGFIASTLDLLGSDLSELVFSGGGG